MEKKKKRKAQFGQPVRYKWKEEKVTRTLDFYFIDLYYLLKLRITASVYGHGHKMWVFETYSPKIRLAKNTNYCHYYY